MDQMALRFTKGMVGSSKTKKLSSSSASGIAPTGSTTSDFDSYDSKLGVDIEARDLLIEGFDSLDMLDDFHRARLKFIAYVFKRAKAKRQIPCGSLSSPLVFASQPNRSDSPQRWVPYLKTGSGTQVFQRTFAFCPRSPVKMTKATIEASPKEFSIWISASLQVEQAIKETPGLASKAVGIDSLLQDHTTGQ